jgi:hypothetical protein
MLNLFQHLPVARVRPEILKQVQDDEVREAAA